MTQLDFNEVIPQAQRGNKVAHDRLMLAFYAWSITQVGEIIRDPEAAKNVALEFWTWLRAGGIKDCRTPETFYTWMMTVIRNMAITRARKKQPKIVYGLNTTPHGGAGYTHKDSREHRTHPNNTDGVKPSFTDESDLRHDLAVIARRLKPIDQKVLNLLLDRATPQQIADECGFTLKSAQNRISRIRKKIREVY